MGTLTYLQIKEEVLGFLGNRDDFTSRIDTIVNIAQMRIARLSKFEELKTSLTDDLTLTGGITADKVYTLPTNLRNIFSIKVYEDTGDRYVKLVGLSSTQFDKKFTKPSKESRNMPVFYHRWGSTIEMYPIIDKNYKIDIRYNKWPTVLAADGDLSDLQEKDDAIITLAASWMFMSLKKKEDANFQWGVYKNMMKDILGEDRESSDITYGVDPRRPVAVGLGYDNPFVRGMN
ncbi:MAG: hypothetical protein COA94_04785 [Rickettsiales bacterium]|nr:MAG: hypothetical protein COA94_04785 [Rickettsiales bacterium]